MSLLRSSIVGRLLKAAGPAALRPAPAFAKYSTQTAIGTPLTESDESKPNSSVESRPQAKDTQIRHNNPDWNVEVDQASSYAQLAPMARA
jgi:NADH dehydrogenase (ubiquinone) Fe-S protein 4